MKKWAKITLTVTGAVAVAALSFLFYAAAVTSGERFDEKKIVSPSPATVYLDDCGDQMSDLSVRDNIYVPLEDLPDFVGKAFVAIEDKRFYTHKGLDFRRMAGAAIKNLKSRSFGEGASTISQQLIKNTHLSSEKTINRKLKEIKLTLALERRHTKDEILEAYLNTIYFGENAYGIGRAAEVYFGKEAEDLSLEEAATLAAVIKAPATYSPYRHPEAAEKRRKLVLKCMLEQGYISAEEFDKAKDEEIALNYSRNGEIERAYIDCVKAETEEILSKTGYGLYDKLKIYTYFDRETAEKIRGELDETDLDCNKSVLVTDSERGAVTVFLTDVGLIRRSPASTVKPWLVYAPSLECGLTAATKILDEKTDFNGYSPSAYNDVYYGYISLKEALERSLNVPAVKLADYIGTEKMKKVAAAMNVKAEGGLGMALGGLDGGMTLKEIGDCYSVFGGRGCFCESKFIKRIENAKGKILYEHKTNEKRIFKESTAGIINDALSECATSGTAKKLKTCGLPLCAKTGTNGNKNGNTDAYCISYSPEFTLAVWLGNADNSPMPNSISGGTYPTIISGDIWKILAAKKQITPFPIPGDVVKVRLDREKYENDLIVAAGDDGPEFLFAAGTEPIPVPETCENQLLNVKQSCSGGKYSLSFGLCGYDGAEITGKAANGRNLKSEVTGMDCRFSADLKEGVEYIFSITPFNTENGRKIYGEEVKLPPVKYIKPRKKEAPPSDWWRDE